MLTGNVTFMPLLIPKLLQNNVVMALNFTAIGLAWKFESLYVLYNKDTIGSLWLHENIEGIFRPTSGYFSKHPFIIADEESSLVSLHEMGGFSFNSLMVILAADIYDPVFKKADQITRNKKNICNIIFLMDDYDHRNLEILFKYLFQQQFRRLMVVITKRSHLYTMKAYPVIEILNVTGKSVYEYFPPRTQWDLMGYRIKVPVQIDVPNMFWYYDETSKRIQLDGIGGNLFETFMEVMNVTMDIYPLYVNNSNYLDIAYIQEMLLNESIEISPHLYTTLDRKPIDYSYAYITPSRCMMLPVTDIKQFEVSYILPYHWTTWSLILLFIVMGEVICQIIIRYHPAFLNERICYRYHFPGTMAFYMICVLINIPMPDIKFFNLRNEPLRQYICKLFFYFIIAFSGFCFAQMYSSSLTSRLTVSISVKPKTTVDKIMAMKQPIMATNQTRKIFLKDQRFGHYAVRKMIFTSSEEFHNNRMTMNTSFVYPTSKERWEILEEQQKFLTKKRFWLTDICVGNFPLQYQMRVDSPFKPYLRKFIMYVRETGLHSHWKSNIFRRAKQFGYTRYFKDGHNPKYIDTRKSFSFTLSPLMMCIYFCGILLSSVAFVMELVFKRLSNTKRVKVRRRIGKMEVKFSDIEKKQDNQNKVKILYEKQTF